MPNSNYQLNLICILLIIIVSFLVLIPLRFLTDPIPCGVFYPFWTMLSVTFIICLAPKPSTIK